MQSQTSIIGWTSDNEFSASRQSSKLTIRQQAARTQAWQRYEACEEVYGSDILKNYKCSGGTGKVQRELYTWVHLCNMNTLRLHFVSKRICKTCNNIWWIRSIHSRYKNDCRDNDFGKKTDIYSINWKKIQPFLGGDVYWTMVKRQSMIKSHIVGIEQILDVKENCCNCTLAHIHQECHHSDYLPAQTWRLYMLSYF